MKSILLLFTTYIFTTTTLYAQYKNSSRNNGFKIAAKVNMLSPFVNSLNLSLESKIKGQHSAQIVIQINNEHRKYSSWFTGLGDLMYTSGYSIGLEHRYYINPEKGIMKGKYFSPYLRYIYRDIRYTEFYKSPTKSPIFFKRDVISFGVIVGFQSVLKWGYGGVDIFGGIGGRMKWDSDFKTAQSLYPINDFIDPKFEFRLGLNLILSNIK